MDILQFVITLLSLLVGGGLSIPFTIKYIRRKENADSMKAVQDVYQETLSDLRAERNFQKEEMLLLKEKIKELSDKINLLERENEELKREIKKNSNNIKRKKK